MTHPTMQRVFDATNKTPTEIAETISTKPQNINNWANRGISKSGALEIGKAFGLSVDWILTGQGEMTAKTTNGELMARMNDIMERKKATPKNTTEMLSVQRPVPVATWVIAGSWDNATDGITWDDFGDDTEYLPRPTGLSSQGFCLKVRGESMLPEFRPDEYIYIEPMVDIATLKNGDLVVVRENGNHEATFKQLVLGDTSDDMYLRPLNPQWHEQRMTPKSEWELVGKVVGKWVRY